MLTNVPIRVANCAANLVQASAMVHSNIFSFVKCGENISNSLNFYIVPLFKVLLGVNPMEFRNGVKLSQKLVVPNGETMLKMCL